MMEDHGEEGIVSPDHHSDTNHPPTPKTPRPTPGPTPSAEEPPAWARSLLENSAKFQSSVDSLQSSVDSLQAQIVDLKTANE